MKQITVTAAIIVNDNNELLICRRADGSSMGGLWEFPGGKLEPGETLEECIVRECKEELSVDIAVIGIFKKTQYRYPDKLIDFTFFNAYIVNGCICMNVHKEIKWIPVSEIRNYEFCPADAEILDMLVGGCYGYMSIP